MPNIPVTSVAGQNFNYHLQTNLPGLSNRLNVNVTHQLTSKLSLAVNYNLSDATSHSLSSFPGIEGNTFTRGQSVMIGLTQNWTKTFMHTSQLYFSRNRSLGLNEFSNLTDISSQLGLTGISPNPFDYGLPYISFTNFTGLSDPNFSLARSQTYRYVDSLRWMKTKHTVTVGGEVRKMDINRDTDPVAERLFCIYRIDDQPADCHGHSGHFSRQLPDGCSPPGRASETISRIFFSATRRIRRFNMATRPRTSATGASSATPPTTGTCSRNSR